MNNNKKHKLDDEDIKKFSEKIKAEVSERTLAIYVKILMDIRDDNLVINSRSRAKQVKAVLKKCKEKGIEVVFDFSFNKTDGGDDEYKTINRINNKVVSKKQLEMILNYLPKSDLGYQLGIAILISYNSGLRLEEVLSIKRDIIKVIKNKNGKLYQISITGKGSRKRNVYLNYKKFNKFFKDFNNFVISYSYIQTTLKRTVIKLGLNWVSFHSFRHSYATNCVRNNANILGIKKVMGHSSIRTTQIYFHLDDDEMIEDFQNKGIL